MALVTVDESLLVTEVPMLDKTGLSLVSEVSKLVLLKELEIGHNVDELTDWGEFGAMVRDDTAPIAFPAAETRFKTPFSTKASSSAEAVSYTAPINVTHYGTGALADSEVVKVGHLQFHRCLPFDTQFSAYQAFVCMVDALPAGTYNVTFASDAGGDTLKGKTFQFTTTQDVPAGGKIAGFRSYTGREIRTYAADSATVIETVTATEGSSGISLGTMTNAGVAVPASGTPETTQSIVVNDATVTYYGLNSIQRAAYGNNRWLHSPLRKFLNSYGFDWWSPATVFDLAPAYAARQGFLSGLPESMVEHMLPIARKTALNYVTDGGTSGAPVYDTTYDLVTLPSGREHFLADTSGFGGGEGMEGDYWEYWERVAGSTTPLAWNATHPEYVQYDLASPTTARFVWVRSASRGHGHGVAVVLSSGSCNSSYAFNGYRAAPACAIG